MRKQRNKLIPKSKTDSYVYQCCYIVFKKINKILIYVHVVLKSIMEAISD